MKRSRNIIAINSFPLSLYDRWKFLSHSHNLCSPYRDTLIMIFITLLQTLINTTEPLDQKTLATPIQPPRMATLQTLEAKVRSY